jgi:hypothetical protein
LQFADEAAYVDRRFVCVLLLFSSNEDSEPVKVLGQKEKVSAGGVSHSTAHVDPSSVDVQLHFSLSGNRRRARHLSGKQTDVSTHDQHEYPTALLICNNIIADKFYF